MSERRWVMLTLAVATTLALLVGACSGDDDAGDRGAPNARVVPWPIPNAGLPAETRLRPDQLGALDAGRPRPPLAEPDAGPALIGDPTLDQLDPDEVYIFGTLSEGACYRDAIAPALAPDDALVGFDCNASIGQAFVRPSDGRMLYAQLGGVDGVYGFHCDGCNYAASLVDYPSNPRANDEPIPMPACEDDASRFSGGFLVTAEGGIAYRCYDGRWYDGDGQELVGLPASYVALSVGREGTALVEDGVLDLTTGEVAPFEGLVAPSVRAIRAREDGYWIAIRDDAVPASSALWHVAFDATATLVGDYPDPPADQEVLSESELDGQGRLVQFARHSAEAFRDTIIRRSVEGESAVIYDEADGPVVKLHISSLFTGP